VGSKFCSGDKIEICFCSDDPIEYIDSVNPTWLDGNLNPSSSFNYEFQNNIELEPKNCHTLTYTIPQNVQPDARYIVLIAYNNTSPISGSFFINKPDFGLVVTQPESGYNAVCGGELSVEWEDPYKKYQELALDILLTTVKPPYLVKSLASNVPVSAGKKSLTLPQSIESRRDYDFVFLVNRTVDLGTEDYISNTFTIAGC
ncbi:3484_t:CDS:2, partial [Racocetra persica]